MRTGLTLVRSSPDARDARKFCFRTRTWETSPPVARRYWLTICSGAAGPSPPAASSRRTAASSSGSTPSCRARRGALVASSATQARAMPPATRRARLLYTDPARPTTDCCGAHTPTGPASGRSGGDSPAGRRPGAGAGGGGGAVERRAQLGATGPGIGRGLTGTQLDVGFCFVAVVFVI